MRTFSTVASAILCLVAAPAQAETSTWLFGVDAAALATPGSWGDVTGPGFGALLRLEYGLSARTSLMGRVGYIGHFATDAGAGLESNTTELPVLLGLKLRPSVDSSFYLAPELGLVSFGAELDGNIELGDFVQRSEMGAEMRVGMTLGAGFRLGSADVRGQLFLPWLAEAGDFVGLMVTVGFDLFQNPDTHRPTTMVTHTPAPPTRPSRPVAARPQIVHEPVETDTQHQLSGATLALAADASSRLRQGRVSVALAMVDGRACDDALVGRAQAGDRTVSTCLADPLTEDLFVARVEVHNGLPHVLRLHEAPLALRAPGGDAHVVFDLSHLAGHWERARAETAQRGRVLVAANDGAHGPDAEYVMVRHLDHGLLSPLVAATSLDLQRPLLPGETRRGYVVLAVPATLPLEAPLTLGLYDVVVETEPGGRSSRSVAFEFPLRRRAWTLDVTARSVRSALVASDGPPPAGQPSEAPAPPQVAPKAPAGPSRVALGTLQLVDEASPVVSRWVGSQVVAETLDGDVIQGVLVGLRSTVLLIRLEDDNRRELDLLDLSALARVAPAPE